MLGSRLASALVLSAALVTGCGPRGGEATAPDPGISRALAQARARRIGDLRYDVSVTIPEETSAPITGRVVARFRLSGPRGPLVLDFAPDSQGRIESVLVNGVGSAFQLANGHLVLPSDRLEAGENSVEVGFVAGEAPLTRNAEFVYTLLVPARAHQFLPVFDQPDLKARFTLELTVPDGWEAAANGEEIEREADNGQIRIRYAETPPIPTYLFAFAAGRFSVEEAEVDGRSLRMLHRETDAEKLERNRAEVFRLHASALDQLEDYTGIAYPFGKFAFVLIPDFEFGGMEHPGAIFYRSASILLEESATGEQQLDRASLIAHETSHMWFGDLVTMRWFDDVWMKEVFANFMAARLVNPSFPEVDHELRFLTDHYPAAYSVDRTPGTHPIRQELENLADAASLYGPIIYDKAPIAMRQLEEFVGPDLFRNGVREYLERFRFANASWGDLIAILDAASGRDLAAWSRAWIESPGRPVIRTLIETGDDGRITSLELIEAAPGEGRSPGWPQRVEVVIGSDEETRRERIEIVGERTGIPVGVGLEPRFVLPTGYADFVLDPESRAWLLGHLDELPDPVTRGAAWIALYEEMLGGRVAPGEMLETALDVAAGDETEQVVQRVLSDTREIYWRFLSPQAREAATPRLESILREGIARAPSQSLRGAYFSALYSVAQTPATLGFLERVWSREESIPGLPLAETDEIALAEQLALRSYPRWEAILAEQLARTENPDRRERFAFVLPALSQDPDERARFFDTIRNPEAWEHVRWVLDGLGFLNHPLRAGEAIGMLRPGLELVQDVEKIGVVFFAQSWLRELFRGHNTPEVADIVRSFLDTEATGYPDRLRAIVLQAADPVFRAAAVR